MKTISPHLVLNNNGFNQSIPTRYYPSYKQVPGNINRNATIAQVEYERNACEDELYSLRYGIENLLANHEQTDFIVQQQQRFRNVQNPFRTMTSNINNLNNRKNKSWIDRCSPCCRRWRRNRDDDHGIIPNENIYRDRNYDISPRRIPESQFQSQLYSDSFASTSPSPSISSPYIDRDMSHTRNDSRRSMDNWIDRNLPINKSDTSNLLTSKEVNDRTYNALILKILETKALDCLCSEYSKQNTQKQIPIASSKTNQRVDEHQSDSISITSSPISYESSSVSSLLTDDKPRFITPQLSSTQILSPSSSDIQTPNVDGGITSTSPDSTQHKIKSSLKLNENIQLPKKESKVSIVADKASKSNKSKNKKKLSSKQKRNTKKRSKQPTSKTKKPSRSKMGSKKQSSSKSKKKDSSRPPSRSKSSKKSKSKNSGSARKKRTKPKSNNYAGVMLPTFIYPQAYQEVYRNRQ